MKIIGLILISFLMVPAALAEIVGEVIEYEHDGHVLEGFLAYDDALAGSRPAVLVVHEWRGLNDYARGRAKQLAELGYVAFAVDMYGKGVYAVDHKEAAELSGVYRANRELMRSRVKVGYDLLKNHELTDPQRMGAIGYCFGGSTVLEMARAGFDLKGVVSFHGGLSTPSPAEPGAVKAKVLVLHGAMDKFVNPDVPGFKDEMEAAGADWELVEFEGAAHSFTVPDAGDDPTTGKAYSAKADQESWVLMKEFFEEIL